MFIAVLRKTLKFLNTSIFLPAFKNKYIQYYEFLLNFYALFPEKFKIDDSSGRTGGVLSLVGGKKAPE